MFYFEKIMMASEYDKGKIHNVKYQDYVTEEFAPIKAGYFVTVLHEDYDDVYSAAFTRAKGSPVNIANDNGWVTVAPKTLTDKVLICDPAVVSTLTHPNGNVYRVGELTYDNELEAGVSGRARDPYTIDKFWLGDENFVSAPTVGQYAILTVNSPLLTPVADLSVALPTGGFAVEVVEERTFNAGAEAVGVKYKCIVKQL